MILQALCDYYERKKDDLPPFGFEEKAIPFIIVIDKNGQFIQLENNGEIDNGKTVVRSVRVPKAPGRSGAKAYETSCLLWDHYGYIAAQPKLAKPDAEPTDKDIELADKQNQSFKERVSSLREELPDDPGVSAVDLFLNSEESIDRLKSRGFV